MRELRSVAVGDVDEGSYQMRQGVDEESFGELLASIKKDGVLVPVLLRSCGSGYEVVAGHRRVAAAKRAGLSEVPAQVIDGEGVAGWGGAFAENMFRAGLTAVEEAAGIVDWMADGGGDIDAVARALGRSRAWVEDRVAMLDWPADVLGAVHAGVLSVAAGRNLAGISDEGHRVMLVNYAGENGATARVTAAWRQAWEAGRMCEDPGAVEVAPGGPAVPAVEPYTPCVVCGNQELMRSMRYLPICGTCQPAVVQAAAVLGREGRQ